ncbi:MAG: tetratricopeptide repeat protein [Acidobacteria bacterium]|nr:tetratricopeptide repeat protein [Acidobacteriota bacterium]
MNPKLLLTALGLFNLILFSHLADGPPSGVVTPNASSTWGSPSPSSAVHLAGKQRHLLGSGASLRGETYSIPGVRVDPKALERISANPAFSAAVGHYLAGRYAEAVDAARAGLESRPQTLPLRGVLVASLVQCERLDEAELEAREAVRMAPNAVDPQLNLGFVLFSKRDIAGAESAYRWVLVRDPQNFLALKNLSNLAALRGDTVELERLLLRLQKCHPTHTYPVYVLGRMYFERGDLARAEAIYRKAIAQEHPRHPVFYAQLGMVLLSEGKLDEAERMLHRALEHARMEGRDTEATYRPPLVEMLGDIRRQRGDVPGAQSMYQKVLSERSVSPEVASSVREKLGELAVRR